MQRQGLPVQFANGPGAHHVQHGAICRLSAPGADVGYVRGRQEYTVNTSPVLRKSVHFRRASFRILDRNVDSSVTKEELSS